ncbi:MAG: V4R domain-containing protein [Bacteroidota bacterium]
MNGEYFYPQRMGRIILQAMEEVIGRPGVHAILDFASQAEFIENYPPAASDRTFPFKSVSGLHTALEQAYGPRGGRGVALRIGRASFTYGLREYGPQLGLMETAFRLLPLGTKLHVGAKSFADLFNHQTDQVVRLEETPAHILWHIERCPLCWDRKTAEPVCHLAVGLLQESLYWVSGGKIFEVEETQCIACGDPACTIRIDKQPIS